MLPSKPLPINEAADLEWNHWPNPGRNEWQGLKWNRWPTSDWNHWRVWTGICGGIGVEYAQDQAGA